MTPLDAKTQQVVDAIVKVLELCHQQNTTTTWRDIFLFLRFPPAAWHDMPDLDEPIIVRHDGDLMIMKAMISSYFATK
jgi:hypothetical protein